MAAALFAAGLILLFLRVGSKPRITLASLTPATRSKLDRQAKVLAGPAFHSILSDTVWKSAAAAISLYPLGPSEERQFTSDFQRQQTNAFIFVPCPTAAAQLALKLRYEYGQLLRDEERRHLNYDPPKGGLVTAGAPWGSPATALGLPFLLAHGPRAAVYKPEEFRIKCVSQEQVNAFTCGTCDIFITQPAVDGAMSDPARGPDVLFFIAAHELGHVYLGHTKRVFQLMKLERLMSAGTVFIGLGHSRVQAAIDERVVSLGNFLALRYSPLEELEADRWALDLCKRSSVNVENALDAMRWFCLLEQADQCATQNQPMQSHPDTLYRLKVLLEGGNP
ncbi:MAG: M48 family metalloprotease [Verrucomicrobiota bacterium]